jgi:DNA recombination protein RmuC
MQQVYQLIERLSVPETTVLFGIGLFSLLLAVTALLVSARRHARKHEHQTGIIHSLEQQLLNQEHEADLERAQADAAQQRLVEQLQELRERFDNLQQQWHTMVSDYAEACSDRDKAQTRAERYDVLFRKSEDQEQQLAALQSKLVSRNVELEQLRQTSEEKLALVQEAQKRAANEFEVLANRIFEDKQRANQRGIELTLNPLKDQLEGFKKQIQNTYEKESRERFSLTRELEQLKSLNQQMSEDAVNLTNALKGENKTLGNWGELILERVLEDSGLRKGVEYETQVSLKGDDGERRQPDVIIRLPDQRDLVIDAKASLLAYEAYCQADTDAMKQEALAAHVASIRNHVRSLSVKAYQNLEGIRTLDFVFVFLPVESAFMLAFEAEQSLFAEAYERNIIVVSPTTLLATLRTVQNIWRFDRQNRNSELIAQQAGGLHDQFVLVLDSLGDLGNQLDKSRDAYEKTLDRISRGRGNVLNRTQKLKELGAKTKRLLPEELLALDAVE